jgi:hypothetical protein
VFVQLVAKAKYDLVIFSRNVTSIIGNNEADTSIWRRAGFCLAT